MMAVPSSGLGCHCQMCAIYCYYSTISQTPPKKNLLQLLCNIPNPISDILIRLSQLSTTRPAMTMTFVFLNPVDLIYRNFILVLVSWISGHFHFKPADYSLTPFAKIESPQMLSHDMDINNKQTTLQSDINIKRKKRANMVKFHLLPLQQCR